MLGGQHGEMTAGILSVSGLSGVLPNPQSVIFTLKYIYLWRFIHIFARGKLDHQLPYELFSNIGLTGLVLEFLLFISHSPISHGGKNKIEHTFYPLRVLWWCLILMWKTSRTATKGIIQKHLKYFWWQITVILLHTSIVVNLSNDN